MSYNGFMNPSYYGNYRTRIFTDIFPQGSDFLEQIRASHLPIDLTDEELITIYYLIYARYGNSSIASSDENRFKYNLYAIIFSYGPTWAKRLEIQKKLRKLSEEELLKSRLDINNHAYNPSTTPSTVDTEELPTVNEQQVAKVKRSKIEGYALLNELLVTDVTEYFLSRFKNLFIWVVTPDLPLWYVSDE